MVDYKYHVTTLVAIFLALGIGILIGSMLLGSDFVVEQQKLLIDRLENDFRQVRIQNGLTKNELAAARDEVKKYESFSSELLPVVVKDKLAGLRIAVIQTNNGFNVDETTDLLRLSGAEIKSVTSIFDEFTLSNVSANFSEGVSQGNELVRCLGESILFGDRSGMVSVLKDRKMIRMTGNMGDPIDAVILVGGSEMDVGDQAKWLDVSLLDYFLENNIKVVGVEPSNSAFSFMNYYQTKPVPTVDNVDTVPGKIALVYALTGIKGNFGIKKTAERLIPALAQE